MFLFVQPLDSLMTGSKVHVENCVTNDDLRLTNRIQPYHIAIGFVPSPDSNCA